MTPIETGNNSIGIELESLTCCPGCGSDGLQQLFTAADTLHQLPGEWGVHRCRRCGLMLTSPRPDRRAITAFYPEDYQPFSAPHAPRRLPRWKRVARAIVGPLLDTKEWVLPRNRPPGNALEVGCGSGRFLLQLADMGWSVQGLEPSPATAEALRSRIELPIQTGTINSGDFDPGSFDLIVAIMVLEHLHNPFADAQSLHTWLRPGGHIMGSVPNCASWEFRFFGPDWYALQVPTHLFHFTPKTLTNLLEHAGFCNIRIFHQRNVNNLMVHLGRFLKGRRLPGGKTCLEFPERGSTALRYAVRPVASMLAWLRQAGRITFLARK
jgi:SAM-dependent methyltransferase